MERTEFTRKQLSDWWFDLSKIAVGAAAAPLFDNAFTNPEKVIAVFTGATISLVFAITGVQFSQQVKNHGN